jgi:hypothetical protein
MKQYLISKGKYSTKAHILKSSGDIYCGLVHLQGRNDNQLLDDLPEGLAVCRSCLAKYHKDEKLYPVEPRVTIKGLSIENHPIPRNQSKKVLCSESRINYTRIYCLYFEAIHVSWVFSSKQALERQLKRINS